MILSAHNEEQHIADRIRNLVELDYPAEKVVIRIGVDGSDDRTAELAREWSDRDPRVLVVEAAEQRGKAAMLKDLVARSTEDILVLTDANTLFLPGALRHLLAPFADPTVGGVCGRLVFTHPLPAPTPSAVGTSSPRHHAPPEGAYWRWETALKRRESALDSCLGANGAIYAVRRDLFWDDLPDNTIIDDFVIGLKVREQGFRMLYEPAAVAEEEFPAETAHEWGRRTRIGAGGFQALVFCRSCLLPRYGMFAWVFWSHKVLRWFTAHVMLVMLLVAAAQLTLGPWDTGTEGHWGWRFTPAALTLLAACGIAGAVVASRIARRCLWAGNRLSWFLELTDHFMTMQAALFVGFIRFCRGDLKGHWQRTPRG